MLELTKIRVGISAGDPNGIGFEIILKTFQDEQIYDFFIPIVFAHPQNLIDEQKNLGISVNICSLKDLNKPNEGQLNIISCWQEAFSVKYGYECSEAGSFAISSLKSATQALKNGAIDILVTAPIHKKNIQSETFKFPGHTDYLNQELEGESLMFMITDKLKVALASDHIPLSAITTYLTLETIEKKIFLLEQSLIQDFGIKKPKIAVLGINPHTGDNGVIGQEDDTLLRPLIQKQINEGKMIFGPFAADGFFGNKTYREYDAILAMYHDQGMIPFKTLSFGEGVNFTAGLNYIRTSPDHGTAMSIAGKGEANPSSFYNAMNQARSIFLKRRKFKKLK